MPEQAEAIVSRVETLYDAGHKQVQPDCVCYDALINAIGWSNMEGRSLKCYSIYQKMLHLYRSGHNVFAKPDIITCNSVLNACAFDNADSDDVRATIMKNAIQIYEDYESNAPKFGWPNHITYSNLLLSIHKHVTDPVKRIEMAETTFWQCCRKGLVSVMVITSLHRTLPFARFSDILGDALISKTNDDALHFDWKILPTGWTRYSPKPNERRVSRPSPKRQSRSHSMSKPSTTRLLKS
jgi:hypothetical protein